MQTSLQIPTSGPGLYDFTREAQDFVRSAGIEEGLLTCFVRHTSCSLTIQENADPDVRADLQAFFAALVPPSDDPKMSFIRHTAEGPDDMPAHIKAALTQTSLSVPVGEGQMLLGTWQGLYLFEHRDASQQRQIILHLS